MSLSTGEPPLPQSPPNPNPNPNPYPYPKKRVFGIARGECGEAVGVIEVGALAGYVERSVAERCVQLGDRLYALLTGLAR